MAHPSGAMELAMAGDRLKLQNASVGANDILDEVDR
jgi:hypothetical protein